MREGGVVFPAWCCVCVCVFQSQQQMCVVCHLLSLSSSFIRSAAEEHSGTKRADLHDQTYGKKTDT